VPTALANGRGNRRRPWQGICLCRGLQGHWKRAVPYNSKCGGNGERASTAEASVANTCLRPFVAAARSITKQPRCKQCQFSVAGFDTRCKFGIFLNRCFFSYAGRHGQLSITRQVLLVFSYASKIVDVPAGFATEMS
jgi:hypothetical protein